MLDMEAISKIFRTTTVETHALRGFSIKVEAGEFVAVTGHSGSGKTTFLNVAGLLEEFEGGCYRLDGQDVTHLNDRQRSQIRNEKIGFIFQGFNLIPDLDIYDNIAEPLHYRPMPARERHERVTAALERVGLSGRARHLPSQLSGGQQQRAAIARATAGQPHLILADEPTGNLDTTMSNQIMDLLQEINASGTTIIMVTHNPELAQRAHRQVHLTDGQIAYVEHFASDRRAQTAATSGVAAPE
jgi:putative ABC transport system ATP-binding protein